MLSKSTDWTCNIIQSFPTFCNPVDRFKIHHTLVALKSVVTLWYGSLYNYTNWSYRPTNKIKTIRDTITKDAIIIILGYRSETLDKLVRIPSHPIKRTRREILYKRIEEDDNPVFPKAEFEEIMKDPETLYKEIMELIRKITEL